MIFAHFLLLALMSHINCYLTFAGNCREALTFYHDCLGGQLEFQTIGESPLQDNMPSQMSDFILHGTLKRGDLVIMASDMVGSRSLVTGNNISLMLHCSSEAEIEESYEKLSSGGIRTHPLENTFWNARMGDLTDKYGNQWMLYFEKANAN